MPASDPGGEIVSMLRVRELRLAALSPIEAALLEYGRLCILHGVEDERAFAAAGRPSDASLYAKPSTERHDKARAILLDRLRVAVLGAGADENFVQQVQRIGRARANRWHDGGPNQWSGLEWAGAICGEAGEAANVAKKLRRIELDLAGNAAAEHDVTDRDELVAKLGRECADTFIYLVNLASRYEIDLSAAIVSAFNAKSIEMGFPERITP